MTQIKLVASDLDHTLLRPSGTLAEATVSLLQQLATIGIDFVPVSGRDLPTLLALLPGAEWVIAHNGAVVAHRGRVIQARLLAKDTVKALINRADALGALPVLCRLNGAELLTGHAKAAAQLRHFFMRVTEVSAFTRLDDVAKVTLLVSPSRLAAVQAAITAQFGSILQVTAGEADALGITDARVNKGAALTALCQRLHVPLAQVLAFGDAQNDAPMLQAAGFGMRMADGDPALAGVTPLVAPPNAEKGVDQVLKQLIDDHGTFSQPKGV